MNPNRLQIPFFWKPLLIGSAGLFLYAGVLAKLVRDWWSDENYSHGLLIPAVIAFIVAKDLPKLREAVRGSNLRYGIPLLISSLAVLFAGTLGAELYLQRLSIVLFLTAVVVCFFGVRVLLNLWLPIILLLLSIPIPQIIFNKIAFPLQIWASQIAELSLELLRIPAVRNGNIIELVPLGTSQVAALEVVEACSGIRSLMTLATLAFLLAYFTRSGRGPTIRTLQELVSDPLLWRGLILAALAIPIALITNALRVTGSGLLTYFYGVDAAEGTWHGISGFGVFVVAFILMAIVNFGLLKLLPKSRPGSTSEVVAVQPVPQQLILTVFIVVVSAGVFVNWLEHRGEVQAARRDLASFPIFIDGTVRISNDIRFPESTEKVLRASDYIMRDYQSPSGQKLNLYIGYYGSQRTGATYHSPRNCLPGTGWELSELDPIQVTSASNETFTANRYLVKRDGYKGLMIYWYQGRGRTNASEYWDKLGTIADSILKNRSDGAMVRVMTAIGEDEHTALQQAAAFSSSVAARLPNYVPN